MTTGTEVTGLPRQSEKPPIIEVGVLGWIKENLFSSWTNTILTLVGGYIVLAVVRLTVRFVFFEADWEVVTSNLTLYAIGQYPREEAWRTVASLGLVPL